MAGWGARVALAWLLVVGLGGTTVPHAVQPPESESRTVERRSVELPAPVLTNRWAVELPIGADPDAVATRLGFENLGQIAALANHYLFRLANREAFDLAADEVKQIDDSLRFAPDVIWSEVQTLMEYPRRADPTDPLFGDQWHLRNIGQSGGQTGADANVPPAWDLGYTGDGVTIAVVDDGLQHAHGDLVPNYSASASWDLVENDGDPTPAANDGHGTSAAGVAAADNDGFSCGVGVAYDAAISGIRTSEIMDDVQQATALTYAYQANSIYNNSWGPADDLGTVNGPGTLTILALEEGVTNGRAGLGTVYVWAAGNGLEALDEGHDDVNYDGYANSRFTIAVGATNDGGTQSPYSEPGAAMLVNAPSNGIDTGVTTTDLLGTDGYSTGDCTDAFGGTSSASPVVAGTVALMLDANPNLTWRDVQHILIETATQNHPADSDWTINGAGYPINHKYGFGRVDAAAAVSAASSWATVAPAVAQTSGLQVVGSAIPDDDQAGIIDTVTVTNDMILEHVEVVLDVPAPYSADFEVELTSPSGTQSVLAERHSSPADGGYLGWQFMSVRYWGESAVGEWSLRVADRWAPDVGMFDSWELILHGVSTESGPGRISGSVTEAGSGSALESILVLALDASTGLLGESAITDSSGSYAVSGLPPGTYSVEFWDGAGDHVTEYYSDQPDESTATPVVVNADTTTTGIDASLAIAGRIAGAVTDWSGNPIEGIDVGAWSTDGSILYEADATDIDGNYVIERLAGGSYEIAFSDITGVYPIEWYDGVPDDALATPVSVTPGTITTGIDAVLGEFIPPSAATFLDVPVTHLFFGEIEWMVAAGITLGCDSAGTVYCPNDSVTRAQMASFLARALDLVPVPGDRFSDVSGTHEPNINAIADAGITLGCDSSGTLYCPEDNVTRGQMAAFLYRALTN